MATPLESVTDTPLNAARNLVRCGDCRYSQPVNAAEPLGRCLCTVGLVEGGGSPYREHRCRCWQRLAHAPPSRVSNVAWSGL